VIAAVEFLAAGDGEVVEGVVKVCSAVRRDAETLGGLTRDKCSRTDASDFPLVSGQHGNLAHPRWAGERTASSIRGLARMNAIVTAVTKRGGDAVARMANHIEQSGSA
jgi:hypothetical protein